MIKSLADYHREGKHPWCKTCANEYAQQYRTNNKGLIQSNNKKYYQDNKEKKKEYDHNRLEFVRIRDRERYATDANFRIRRVLRTRLYKTIKGIKSSKSVLRYLEMDVNIFKTYLEFQFSDRMSWDNYAKVWEIDHVAPCSCFDLTKEEEKAICFNWKNMRPLLKSDNLAKSSSYDIAILVKHQSVVEEFLSTISTKSV